MKKNNKKIHTYWRKKGLVFAMGFYISIMIMKFIVEKEVFTWKKPFGNLVLALLMGYIWSEAMKAFAGKNIHSHKQFTWWKFAAVTALATLLIVLISKLLFWEPLSFQILFLSFVIALMAGSVFGLLLQLIIFKQHSKP